MNPRLVAIGGPLRGHVFPLEDQTSVGRDPANRICINEQWVSRHHCLIKTVEEKLQIVDLGSHNGTFVDGVPVQKRYLRHGDRIDIADSSFVVLLHEDAPRRASGPVRLLDEEIPARATVRLRREDALYLKPDKLSDARLATRRLERDLRALLRVSAAIPRERDLASVQKAILDEVFEIVPAERGAILSAGDEPGSFRSELTQRRIGTEREEDEPFTVSRTVVAQTLREATAILAHLPESPELARVESLATRRVQSVLCIPLIVGDRTLGVLYLDTCDPRARFDPEDLEILTAIADIAAAALEAAGHLADLESENRQLREESRLEHNMVGDSTPMRAVYRFIAKVAPTDSTVLLAGESGTGKELAARAIHQNSPRAHKPFVKIDCSTLTETLLESELFGHEKGAFTGAIAQKKGRIELADGGTVFLDEVGELPLPLQSKLLRVLQDREFERIGGTRPISVDVRFIAASNRDLVEETKQARFRQDLYYRLSVVAITLPPLRERREDIAQLAGHFITKHSRRVKRRGAGISPEALRSLEGYDWPGNVRELENAIERAIVLGSTDLILPDDLTESILDARAAAGGAAAGYHEAIVETKKRVIREAVRQAGGNYTEAAGRLGIHPNYLHRLIRILGIKGELKDL